MEVIKPRPPNPMSEEQLKAFLEAVKADAELQEKLKAAKDVEAVVEIAKAAGFVISAEELKSAQAELRMRSWKASLGVTTLPRGVPFVAAYRPRQVELYRHEFPFSHVNLFSQSPCGCRGFGEHD